MLGALPSVASANGAYTHAHISQLAVERLEAGALRDLLVDPAMPPYWQAGSLFPDSGDAVSDDHGELAHWERFLGAYIAWLRARFAGDYTSEDARRHVAFLMGIASHGMADQTYDTTLLARAFEVDGPESSEAPVDQYADYFIVIDAPSTRTPALRLLCWTRATSPHPAEQLGASGPEASSKARRHRG